MSLVLLFEQIWCKSWSRDKKSLLKKSAKVDFISNTNTRKVEPNNLRKFLSEIKGILNLRFLKSKKTFIYCFQEIKKSKRRVVAAWIKREIIPHGFNAVIVEVTENHECRLKNCCSSLRTIRFIVKKKEEPWKKMSSKLNDLNNLQKDILKK